MEQTTRRYRVTKMVRQQNAYYTVRWSPIVKAERIEVSRGVPSVSGIAELYYLDDHKHLNLFYLARCYYGGLRSTIRAAIDPEVETDARRRGILLQYEDAIFFRYTCVDAQADMNDILYFYLRTYRPSTEAVPYTGQYRHIYLKELDTGVLHTLS